MDVQENLLNFQPTDAASRPLPIINYRNMYKQVNSYLRSHEKIETKGSWGR